MYTVIGGVRSRTMRVLWMLEELGLPYEHVSAAPRSPEALAANPSGKVPVLLVEGKALTDSSAILAFLADRHGALTFAPGTLERARQDGLMHKVLDEIDAVLWTAARHSFVLPEDQRMPDIKGPLRWEFARSCAALADDLGAGPYLMGETFTFADIVFAHCLGWAMNAHFPVDQQALVDYNTRCRERPAFLRAASL